ncbi:MAG: glycosyltransferase, partial [Microvirga sp.]
MAHNVLFIHQNFPGQYKLLAETLASNDRFNVVAIGQRQPFAEDLKHLHYIGYSFGPAEIPDLFPPLLFFSEQVRRAGIVRTRLIDLKQRGFAPDVCFVHPGWGDALFLRDVFPETRLVAYLEHYYTARGADLDFDPEFHGPATDLDFVSLRNLPILQAAAVADVLISPTAWQASRFPEALRQRIDIVHEGIDTHVATPGPAGPHRLSDGRRIEPGGTLITYVSRSLEPYRGFHTFMRALPSLLERLPDAQIALVGGLQPSSGRSPTGGGTWKEKLLAEVGPRIDHERVHFLGRLPYKDLLNLFRLSTVHVYLTSPFVLSWSLIDAMACGCAIVASDTTPVREVIEDGRNG